VKFEKHCHKVRQFSFSENTDHLEQWGKREREDFHAEGENPAA
jgi:hypothetical protein